MATTKRAGGPAGSASWGGIRGVEPPQEDVARETWEEAMRKHNVGPLGCRGPSSIGQKHLNDQLRAPAYDEGRGPPKA
eukprot:2502579-Alexandrium_andersonii.AAC.1